MGLDKTADGYQEEVVLKLLKDIIERDGLANGVIRQNNMPNRPNDDDRPDRPDDRPDRPDRPDDRPDRPDDRSDRHGGALGSVFLNNLNININNIESNGEHYARLIANQNATIKN